MVSFIFTLSHIVTVKAKVVGVGTNIARAHSSEHHDTGCDIYWEHILRSDQVIVSNPAGMLAYIRAFPISFSIFAPQASNYLVWNLTIQCRRSRNFLQNANPHRAVEAKKFHSTDVRSVSKADS